MVDVEKGLLVVKAISSTRRRDSDCQRGLDRLFWGTAFQVTSCKLFREVSE